MHAGLVRLISAVYGIYIYGLRYVRLSQGLLPVRQSGLLRDYPLSELILMRR